MGKKAESGGENAELVSSEALSEQKAAVIKVAKKLLKNSSSDNDEAMKIKNLVQMVCKKVTDTSFDQVKSWIQSSSKFEQLDKKKIVLKRKRSKDDSSSDEKTEIPQSKIPKSKSGDKGQSSTDDISKWRDEQRIVLVRNTTDGTKNVGTDPTFFPARSFEDCRESLLPSLVQQCTVGNGFDTPSPIQAQAWPILNNGHDVVGIAETGSGKTLAFALPALTRLAKGKSAGRRNMSAPRMLVLAPTRELAMQSEVVLKEFGAVVGLQSLVIYGGVPKYTQISTLKKGNVDCLVATPGRLKDLIQEGSCSLSACEFLVLDEADRMLDMGFEMDVRFIISECPTVEKGRQTAMFSATWPAAIQKIAMEFMQEDPVRVYVGFEKISSGEADEDGNTATMVDDSLSANKRVTQHIEVIDDMKRPARLRQILNKVHKGQKDRLLLFCLYKNEVERMEYALQREGWKCCSIHGNKQQQARTSALKEFKDGTCPLMIATDVAARGLDIPNVEVVINYTFPLTIEDYVHRIGRTGRAGLTGVSYTFFQPTADKTHAGALQHVLRTANQEIPEELAMFGSTIKKKEHKMYGSFGPKDGPMKKSTKITFESDEE
mmetsp:Transcript_11312/g.14894  ORF Transcript_11312/g.14894 Transcript_11312/m.14894 type:complete len:603 (-) Transcript_11312:851-2659(-)|eukprot:CAMPEP_0198140424 /NCGR_PEP_ID=MMETSP1443-20131203/3569_1 /TAXON_ID=186043 /ORGANISM="Entomoneis sp., Strain CCMP2396" /LENGTH=602 /DNA_ID=CAMNT_0043802829 /DNA_START=67 /DNA_END=1875 /DNA_ORIENTATION=+